ncbi:hypothetical protein DFH07DRAFT_778246 [Mycena maculata]|uniref:Uncharacterized protein n=1 Tax=Mycena maculata TaxID=230809 RepID=A0AAD7IEI3_9AGAR|nr:hypothetical protein DFH07DRAFT_778246 [Mycena maculata]
MFRLLLPSPGENEESNSDSDFGSGNDLAIREPSTTFTFHCLSLLLLPASSPLGPKHKEPSPDLIATTSSQRPTKRYKPAATEEELDALEPEACKKLRKLIKRHEHCFTVRKVVWDFATSPLEQQKVIPHVQDYNIQGAAMREAKKSATNQDEPSKAPAFELPEAREYSLEEILDPTMQMHLVDWDGVPAPLVNEDCYVFALLGGHPNDPGWKSEVADPAAAAMEAAAEKMYGQAFYGVYRAKSAPSTLLAMKPFQCLAGYINNPSLPRNFNEFISVFATATFNFGLRTIMLPHLDFVNLAWGWCSIVTLGNFKPDKGGHLILWDLCLIIGFPPGSTIFIPSAILRHSNVPIQQG